MGTELGAWTGHKLAWQIDVWGDERGQDFRALVYERDGEEVFTSLFDDDLGQAREKASEALAFPGTRRVLLVTGTDRGGAPVAYAEAHDADGTTAAATCPYRFRKAAYRWKRTGDPQEVDPPPPLPEPPKARFAHLDADGLVEHAVRSARLQDSLGVAYFLRLPAHRRVVEAGPGVAVDRTLPGIQAWARGCAGEHDLVLAGLRSGNGFDLYAWDLRTGEGVHHRLPVRKPLIGSWKVDGPLRKVGEAPRLDR